MNHCAYMLFLALDKCYTQGTCSRYSIKLYTESYVLPCDT